MKDEERKTPWDCGPRGISCGARVTPWRGNGIAGNLPSVIAITLLSRQDHFMAAIDQITTAKQLFEANLHHCELIGGELVITKCLV